MGYTLKNLVSLFPICHSQILAWDPAMQGVGGGGGGLKQKPEQ